MTIEFSLNSRQRELAAMMEAAGLTRVRWFNFAAGICALHVGVRV